MLEYTFILKYYLTWDERKCKVSQISCSISNNISQLDRIFYRGWIKGLVFYLKG